MSEARDALLRHFRWIDGHADVWSVFRDAAALRAVVIALAAPYRSAGISAVAGIESRGFLLGAATAVELGVGFVAVRKAGALFPGDKAREQTERDYRGKLADLLVQRAAISATDDVLLVDDWIETGSQALAVKRLVEACGGQLVGISVLVDQLGEHARALLPPVRSIVDARSLPPDDAGQYTERSR